MKKTLLFLIAASLLPLPASAQSHQFMTRDAGWYWWMDMGATVPQDGHVTQFGNHSAGQPVSYDVGFGMNLSGGFAFNRYFSLEGQVGWTWNSIGSIGDAAQLRDTSLSTVPLMANAVFQCPIPRTRLVPYIGAGAGGAATIFNTDGYTRSTPSGFVTLYGTSADFVFAWQGFAGVRLELNDWMAVGIGYRYLSVNSSSYNYESFYSSDRDVRLGLSKLQSHLAALTFTMRF